MWVFPPPNTAPTTPVDPPPSGEDVPILYNCLTSVAVRQAVYQNTGDHIAPANAGNINTGPCLGLVVSKPSSTTAYVQDEGELPGFSGLTPNAIYYLDHVDGGITKDVSAFPSGSFIQKVGYAKNATTFVIIISQEFVRL